jgi:hypothetical protein
MGELEYEDFFVNLKKCLFKGQAEFLEANKTKYEPRIRDLMEYKKMESVEKFFSDIEADYKKSLEKPKEPEEHMSKREIIIKGTKEELSKKNPALGEYFSKNSYKYKGYINVILNLDDKKKSENSDEAKRADRFYGDMLLKIEKDFDKSRTSV